ncbi:MAG: hypothetical protein RLZZ163_1123, partial [Actinomycetota bacterium]
MLTWVQDLGQERAYRGADELKC